MQYIPKVLAVILCMLTSMACLATDDDLKLQREQFLEARKALREWRMDDFERLSEALQDYPLHPYLEFEKLRKYIQQTDNQEIAEFIKHYKGQPVSWRLRQSWLYALARRKDWTRFLQEFKGRQPVELQCYKLRAEIKTGITETFADDAIRLWLVGRSQEDACDPVFKYLYDNDYITSRLLWQRIGLAMKNNKTDLAGYLARRLSREDRAWVVLWKDAHRLPARTLQSPSLRSDTAIARNITLHALRRIAVRDAMQAHIKWKTIKPRYKFSEDEIGQLEKDIAMQANWQKLPEALDWLIAVPTLASTNSVREWRIRIPIREHNWDAVAEQIDALPVAEAESEEWRYWKATALEKTGHHEEANNDFSALSEERDYHGFLAADWLNKPYRTHHEPLDYDPVILQQLGNRDGFIRARELYRAELYTDARREWAAAISKLSAAIDHVETINRNASSRQLDPGHIFAVIRQESAFGETARSPAGARGLMQLMPKTGRDTARKYHIPLSNTSELYEPEKNILIGSAYLGEVMKQYNDNIVLASAAYNAGPHNVQRWLPRQEKQEPDNWIATITYSETRTYIQRILAYMAIYDWRMDNPITPLKKRMPDIYPKSHYLKTEQ
jgi:soluble lytic murein transglycosylase